MPDGGKTVADFDGSTGETTISLTDSHFTVLQALVPSSRQLGAGATLRAS